MGLTSTADNLHLSISLNRIPKKSFLNKPLMKNSMLGLDGGDSNFTSLNNASNPKSNFESIVVVI